MCRYSGAGIPSDLLQELNTKTLFDLYEWKENLPAYLQVDLQDTTTPYLPHVLLLL
jgi:hypothetical protein